MSVLVHLDEIPKPISDGTVFVLPSHFLIPWSKNPRKEPNPREDEIYADLKLNGYQDVLEITQEPNSQHFVPFRGGNTRVELIGRLREEADERFTTITCRFNTWPGHAKMLSQALSENKNRGDMCYVDDSLGTFDLLKESAPKSPFDMSTRHSSDILKEQGIQYGPSKVSLLLFFMRTYEQHLKWYWDSNKSTIKQADVAALKKIVDRQEKQFEQHGQEQHFQISLSESLRLFEDGADPLQAYLDASLDEKLSLLTGVEKTVVQQSREADTVLEALSPVNAEDSEQQTEGDNDNDETVRQAPESLSIDEVHPVTTEINHDQGGLPTSIYSSAKKAATVLGIDAYISQINFGRGFALSLPIQQLTVEQSRQWWTLLHLSGFSSKNHFEYLPDPSLREALKDALRNDKTALRAAVGNPLSITDFIAASTDPNEPLFMRHYSELTQLVAKQRKQSDFILPMEEV